MTLDVFHNDISSLKYIDCKIKTHISNIKVSQYLISHNTF